MNTAQATDSLTPLQEKLFLEASRDNYVAVQEILSQGVEIETRDAGGRTALLIATHHNAIKVAQLLIKVGANVNAKDSINDSSYLYAGAEGRLEILLMTLNHGADLASVNRYGGTALIPAAHHGHIEIVSQLLKTKIDIDHVNNPGWTALLEAIILGDGGETYIEIVRLLVNAGADVNIADANGLSPLDHALDAGYLKITDILRAATTKN